MAPRARANQSYTWAQVKQVQSLIERCLNQYARPASRRARRPPGRRYFHRDGAPVLRYMTQAEIIATLQVQADIEPALTCLVWAKLEEQNPDFFLSYDIRLRLKDQIARTPAPVRFSEQLLFCANRARFRFAARARALEIRRQRTAGRVQLSR